MFPGSDREKQFSLMEKLEKSRCLSGETHPRGLKTWPLLEHEGTVPNSDINGELLLE